MLFKRKKKYVKETDAQTRDRVLSLCEEGDYGIFAPPMNAQVALDELARHLLGSDYYTNNITNAQGNTEIVYDIERKYKRLK